MSRSKNFTAANREDFSEYVAHLQLHMTRKARNMAPRVQAKDDSRISSLYQTQADLEKSVSRQYF